MTKARPGVAGKGEAGEMLIEILMTVAILGIAGVGLISSMTLTAVGSDLHRRLTDSEAVARSFAEATKNQAIHPVTTTLNAAIPLHVVNAPFPITVTRSLGFPSAPFGIAVDTEEFTVTVVAGNTWTATALGSEPHASGATVTRYEPCPMAAQLTPSYTVPSGARNIGLPTLSLPVEFFDILGQPISVPCQARSRGLPEYWSTAPSPCALLLTPEHLTECDPPLMRVTINVASTDTDGRRKAATSTQLLMRRMNS